MTEIREVLEIRDGGDAPCEHVQHLLSRRLGDLDRQIADLLELRATAAGLHAGAATAEPETCDPATVCRYL